jgi:glutamate/aspartate transport system substrate-binding protein
MSTRLYSAVPVTLALMIGQAFSMAQAPATATSPTAAEATSTPPSLAGRLERIRETQTLVIAYRENALPFSYQYRGQPTGFGVDISKAIAADIQKALNLPELRLRWNPVTLGTRMPLMVTNTVDLECATTTHTKARQKQVDFSHTFYVSEDGMASRQGVTWTPKNAPSSAKVAAVQASTTAQRLKGQGSSLTEVRSNRNGMLALANAEVDAFVAAVPLLASERMLLGSRGHDLAIQTVEGGRPEAFACMLPINEPAFKDQVNRTLVRLMQNGDMLSLYNRWFVQPVPPFSIALDLPINTATLEAYAQPNSVPFE